MQGVAELNRLGREMGVKDELLVMLEHMVLSHHDLPEYGSPKPPCSRRRRCCTVQMMDARIFEMNRALASVQPGSSPSVSGLWIENCIAGRTNRE